MSTLSPALLAVAFAVASAGRLGRRSKRHERTDCYSRYEGQSLLRLADCTSPELRSLQTIAASEGCTVISEGQPMPVQVGGCSGALAICPSTAAVQFEQKYDIEAQLLDTDAGAYYRQLSGLTEEHRSDTVSSLADTQNPARFYEAWQDMEAREARIESAVESSGGIARIESAGESLQGRSIKFVRFTGKGYKSGMPKVVLSFQVHAREWIAGMSGVYAIENLAAKVNHDPEFLAGMEVVLVPLLNPDGFVQSVKHDRFHRKNMRMDKNISGDKYSCLIGVDINRNAPTGWEVGTESDGNSCGETYHGAAPMSEPETQAIVKLFKEAPMSVYMDIHNFAQYIMSAWSYTTEEQPRKKEFDELGAKLQAAIKGKHGTEYKFGQGSKMLYIAAGALADYATTLGALGYVVELRPAHDDAFGTEAFAPPATAILPTAEECFEGVLAAISHAKTMTPSQDSDS